MAKFTIFLRLALLCYLMLRQIDARSKHFLIETEDSKEEKSTDGSFEISLNRMQSYGKPKYGDEDTTKAPYSEPEPDTTTASYSEPEPKGSYEPKPKGSYEPEPKGYNPGNNGGSGYNRQGYYK